MKILIAGYGFVGKAQEIVLKDYHEVAIYDPYLGYDNEWLNLDAIIVCVSTPPNADGSCDVSNVIDIVNRAPNIPILIKSTISVEGWDQIRQQSNNKQEKELLELKLELKMSQISYEKIATSIKETKEENTKLKESVLFYEKIVGKRK